MSMNEVLALALSFSEQERATLAQQLLRSLSLPGQEIADGREWDAACMEEVRRRAERYERGETAARNSDEALREIQARLR
jgi:hypothetical protein